MIAAVLLTLGVLLAVGGIVAAPLQIKAIVLVPLGGVLMLLGGVNMNSNPGTSAPTIREVHIYAPDDESSFVEAIERWGSVYAEAPNDIARVGMRKSRRDAICAAIGYTRVTGWLGTIKEIGTSLNDQGTLTVALPEKGVLGTWSGIFSDGDNRTLIPKNSQLFRALAAMRVGTLIRFDGSFLASERDCVKERSVTEAGSMSDPDFVFQFTHVEAIPGQ